MSNICHTYLESRYVMWNIIFQHKICQCLTKLYLTNNCMFCDNQDVFLFSIKEQILWMAINKGRMKWWMVISRSVWIKQMKVMYNICLYVLINHSIVFNMMTQTQPGYQSNHLASIQVAFYPHQLIHQWQSSIVH